MIRVLKSENLFRIFGALSEAQLHFLVHHFSKCECAKFPKVTSTCWQDWDEKLLEPEVARSTPQQTLHLTAITDSNQTNEIKPNPRYSKITLNLKKKFSNGNQSVILVFKSLTLGMHAKHVGLIWSVTRIS